jgi:hypothetical protein
VFEYKVIPAPRKGTKAKGLKTPESRFSYALEELMNTEAYEGWEFCRAETLPSEERSGFRSTNVVYRSVLVFRRPLLANDTADEAAAYEQAPEPAPVRYEAPLDEDAAEAEPLEQDDHESSSAKA